MAYGIRRFQPGDEQLALQVMRDLMPEDERDGREPTIPHLRHFLSHDANYLIVALAGSAPAGFLTAYRINGLQF